MAKKRPEPEIAAYGAAAQAVAAGRPSHIVVFRTPGERAVSVMQKAVRRYGTKSFSVAEHVVGMGERRAGGRADLQAFSQLGVAVTTLTDDEHRELVRSDEVVAVVPNLRRYILGRPAAAARGPATGGAGPSAGTRGGTVGPILPGGSVGGAPWPRHGGGHGPVRPYGGTVGPVLPAGGGVVGPILPAGLGLGAAPELLAYLAGHRDALDVLIARLAAYQPPISPARRRRAGGEEGGAALTWGLQAVGVTGADGQLTGAGVRVADLDTGLDTSHPDWALFPANDGVHARNFTPETGGIMDVVGHGTHTAGTIAGPVRSAGGTRYGVAPGCELFVGKVLDNSGSGFDSDILEGIQWAITSKCRVINMSLGAPRDPGGDYSVAYETVARNVLDIDGGTLIVAAAGNESARSHGTIAPVGNPAACPSILAVAAIDESFRVADFSCGQVDAVGVVDLAGPGVNVYSSVPVSHGRFDEYSGTSMATPHVTGIAACLLQASPSLTARDLWNQLRAAAVSLPLPPTDVGRGLVFLG
jgi:hypothetical protein